LAERDLNYSKLSEIRGISINALSKMGKEEGTGSKQITYDVLEKLCSALECQVGDLLIWTPKEKK